MAGLKFSFQQMLTELDAFAHLAEKFIAPESRTVLPQFKALLENYRDQQTRDPFDWKIQSANPLKTRVSAGEYEVGKGGKHGVIAQIDACWRIRRIPLAKKTARPLYFELAGIASTRVRLICEAGEGAEHRELAMWRMEVGDDNAPGCHFHVQVLGEKADFPFPNSVPVPRLPSVILTPAAVAEYVLAELFQDDWASHVAYDTPHLRRWAPIQGDRLAKLLGWKLELLRVGGSPWTTIKRHKPDAALFI